MKKGCEKEKEYKAIFNRLAGRGKPSERTGNPSGKPVKTGGKGSGR